VGFADVRFLPFAVLLAAAILLPDFALVFELGLDFADELLDFDVEEGLLFEEEVFGSLNVTPRAADGTPTRREPNRTAV
jgi:hypothetical protein